MLKKSGTEAPGCLKNKPMNVIEEFKQLSRAAKDACEKFGTATDCEPYFLSTLKYVKMHPDEWPEFKHLFVSMAIDPAVGPWELIAFCMRELRWPEVLEVVQFQLRVSQDFRVKEVMAKIAAVYANEWEDGDLYHYYSPNQTRSDLD